MDNASAKTGYNTDMKRVARLERIDIHTNYPHYPWKNKTESVIKTLKGKENRGRVQINIPKKIWDFGCLENMKL